MSDPADPQPTNQAPAEEAPHSGEVAAEGEPAPSPADLEEPSTEKDPAEAPRAPKPDDPEPSHQAVGIGVTDPPFGEEEADAR